MSTQDQIEIIRANGEIEFYHLDPGKGITNIGHHPENDIVIEGPGVAPFHAMLDHRQKPYQLTVLSDEGTTMIGGQPLAPHTPRALQNWDHVELDGHRLILVEGDEGVAVISPGPAEVPVAAPAPPTPATPGPVAAPVVPPPLPARPVSFPPPTTRPEPSVSPEARAPSPPPGPMTAAPAPTVLPAPSPRPTGFFAALPPDREDEVILVDLSEREWTIDVEQTTTLQVTVANGGDLVATFTVSVQGLDESWLVISHPQINLYEGERATVTITITPPRLPTSRAGAHHFAVVVTSANYPGRMSQRGATLIINPYYEFAVGELSPKQQTISWFKRSGRVTVPITNMGNSSTLFRLEGTDDEHACSYEFELPGEAAGLARQAELRLAPEETISVPINVIPHSRRLIGLRRRSYTFTISTTPVEGQQTTPRSMLGELKHKPLIGPWLLLLLILLLIVLIALIVRPRLKTFALIDGGNPRQTVIKNSTPVTISWEASFFTNELRIEPEIEGLEQPIPPRGTVVAYPKADTSYSLKGGNLLSNLAPVLFAPPTKSVRVDVEPIAPEIIFEAEPSQIVGEGEVLLKWEVKNADKIELFRQVGPSGPVQSILDLSQSPIGILAVTPEPNQDSTTYILVASNAYVPTTTPVPRLVSVLTPTPTLPPTPAIIFFNPDPPTINEGQESVLSWRVDGVQEVTIQGPGNVQSIQPADYSMMVQPTGSADYNLIVPGVPPRPARVNVIPATPTPTSTPEPTAPEITFFTGDPDEVVRGDSTTVELKWTVVGTTTNVELSSPELPNPLSNLVTQGSYKIRLDDAALFVLTAFNDTAKSSASVQIEAVDPTPTLTPAPPPTATATPVPPAIITFFQAAAGDANAQLVLKSSTVDKNIYEAVAGSKIILKWEIQQASKVTLVGAGDQPHSQASYTDSKLNPVTSLVNYQLIAENAAGNQTSKFLDIQVVPNPPPAPPTNFQGQQDQPDPGKNTLSWDYDITKQDEIAGFRVYRADLTAADTGFKPWKTLGVSDPPEFTYSVVDTPTTTCGKGYYVVTLYIDLITGDIKETDSATSSWYSSPC